MTAHFEAVEADFQSHYGLDLRKLLWGSEQAGVRRLLALVNGLPADSVTFRKILTRGQPWSTTDELLATVIELIDYNNRILVMGFTGKPKTWSPLRVPRPNSRSVSPPKPASIPQMRKFFSGHVKYVGSDN